jgi:hypothetical protein
MEDKISRSRKRRKNKDLWLEGNQEGRLLDFFEGIPSAELNFSWRAAWGIFLAA